MLTQCNFLISKKNPLKSQLRDHAKQVIHSLLEAPRNEMGCVWISSENSLHLPQSYVVSGCSVTHVVTVKGNQFVLYQNTIFSVI